jgi:hypothetical protein
MPAIQPIEGIWIAEPYLACFDSLTSAILCKDVFDYSIPAGIRVNSKELKGYRLSVGYQPLHQHSLNPEITGCILVGHDTVCENNFFEVDIHKKHELGYQVQGVIPFFNDLYEVANPTFLSWQFSPDTVLILQTKNPRQIIRYKRVNYSFSKSYPYPNALYSYTRDKTLVGTYILRDSTRQIIAQKFKIARNGEARGHSLFANKVFYFSTDIYCGYVATDDCILVCDKDLVERNCDIYIYKRINKTIIALYEILEGGYKKKARGKLLYLLEQKQ